MKKSFTSASKKTAPVVVAVKKAVQKPTHVTRAEIRRAVREVAAAARERLPGVDVGVRYRHEGEGGERILRGRWHGHLTPPGSLGHG